MRNKFVKKIIIIDNIQAKIVTIKQSNIQKFSNGCLSFFSGFFFLKYSVDS